MIDKLDVRVQRGTPFRKEFHSLYRALRDDPAQRRAFHESAHYEVVGDLRDYGYSAILHGHCKHGKSGADKLELIDTGGMTFAGMVNEIERVYDCNALGLEVMRTDMCADIPGVTVQSLQERVWVRYKQRLYRFQELDEPTVMTERSKSGNLQGVVFGNRPHGYRIYDKIGELKNQYRNMQRKPHSEREGELPSFEQCYGYPESGFILTRFERQIAGGRIPPQIGTVGTIQEHGLDYDPFDNLELISGNGPEPSPDEWEFGEWCTGMWIRQMCITRGLHYTRQFINRQSRGNWSYYSRKFHAFLPQGALVEDLQLNPKFDGFQEPEPKQSTISDWREGITRKRITELHWESLSRQLAA